VGARFLLNFEQSGIPNVLLGGWLPCRIESLTFPGPNNAEVIVGFKEDIVFVNAPLFLPYADDPLADSPVEGAPALGSAGDDLSGDLQLRFGLARKGLGTRDSGRIRLSKLSPFVAIALSPALAVSLLLAACSDATAPVDAAPAFAKGGKRATSTATADSPTAEGGGTAGATACGGNGLEPVALRHRADAPRLQAYQVSFVAVQGTANWVYAHYENGEWFMQLKIPPRSQLLRPNGEPAAKGEAVEVTATFDPETFAVSFGPHGSTFIEGNPAVLQFSLVYAELGNCDPSNTAVWYQPYAGDPWTSLSSAWNQKSYWIETDIHHFSNYAVAWSPFF